MNTAEPNAVAQPPTRLALGVGLVLMGAFANVLWVLGLLFGGYEAVRWFTG